MIRVEAEEVEQEEDNCTATNIITMYLHIYTHVRIYNHHYLFQVKIANFMGGVYNM